MQLRWPQAVNKQHPLNRDLLSWYMTLPGRVDGKGRIVRDLMGRHNGVMVDMDETDRRGPFGRPGGWGALLFDEVDDSHVKVSNFPDLTNLTISCWFRITASTQGGLVSLSKDGPSGNQRISLLVDDQGPATDNLAYWDSNNSWTYTGVDPVLGQWYYFVASIKSNAYVRLFVDGVRLANDTTIGAIPNGKRNAIKTLA